MAKFWMVWNAAERTTPVRHEDYNTANDEAVRLARKAPGQMFYVLEAISVSQTCGVITTLLSNT